MAESQKKASSPVYSKAKDSLLDVDFGKDFLSSWKTMSVAEGDVMDFDFGPVTEGKKKAFNFDKLLCRDVDFTLDGDLDKISSFKVDMSDLDISSPSKRAGKSKDRSKESDGGNHQMKQDRFSFQFDFNELDSFSFESSLMQQEKQSSKNQNSEETPSKIKCHGSGTDPTAGTNASEVGLTPKLPASVGTTTSKVESAVGGFGDLDPKKKNCSSNSECNDNHSISETLQIEVASLEARKFSAKTTTTITQEGNQESHQQEKITSAEPYAEETMQDLSVKYVSEKDSTQHTASELQLEICSEATKVHSNEDGDQNDIFKSVGGIGFNGENPVKENSPAQHITRSLSNVGERNKFGSDSNVTVDYTDGAESVQGDSSSENTPSISVSLEAMHDTSASGDAQYANGKLRLATLSSGTSVGKMIQTEEKQTCISQSKYFKKSDETESPSQQAPSTQPKPSMFGGKRIGYGKPGSRDDGRESVDARDAQSGNKLVGISRPHSEKINKGEAVQPGSMINVKGLKGIGCFNPSISSEQTNKSTTQKCGNRRLPSSSIVSVKNSNDVCNEVRTLSSPKAGRSILDPSSSKISRAIGAKPQPSKYTLGKEIKVLRNAVRNVEQGSTASKISLSVSTEKQTTPTPPLKRKAFEGLNADMLTSNPSKRLSPLATETRNGECSERFVNKEFCSNKNPTDSSPYTGLNYLQMPTPDTPRELDMIELEIPLVLENDVNVDKADAYTKELENICNMLKKKHEEAKELLVRAIVNNNKLLMLNHPIYEERIRNVRKFAAELMFK